MRISPPRAVTTIALTGIALVMAVGPAAGHSGDGDKHRGHVGRHAFTDSETKPGAYCRYRRVDAETDVAPSDEVLAATLKKVVVRPPKVAAYDRTRRIDRQWVAWRAILLERIGDGDWTRVARSPIQLARASDKRAANFSRQSVRYRGNPEAEYKVRTKAFWLRRRAPRRVSGVASHLVQYYQVRGELAKSCPGALYDEVVPAP